MKAPVCAEQKKIIYLNKTNVTNRFCIMMKIIVSQMSRICDHFVHFVFLLQSIFGAQNHSYLLLHFFCAQNSDNSYQPPPPPTFQTRNISPAEAARQREAFQNFVGELLEVAGGEIQVRKIFWRWHQEEKFR